MLSNVLNKEPVKLPSTIVHKGGLNNMLEKLLSKIVLVGELDKEPEKLPSKVLSMVVFIRACTW